MTKVAALFLDDGGVLNDNRVRARQWQSLVAAYFPPHLGGASARWFEANGTIFWQAFARMNARLERWQDDDGAYDRELDRYYVDWLRSMCDEVGVAAPASDAACSALARQADEWIIPRVRSAYAGVADAVAALSGDYALYTASGSSSRELDLYLGAMGVRAHFRRLYGPDLVGTPKNRTLYYERIFADAGVDPATVVVVDDSPPAIGWAVAAGAGAVLVGEAPADGLPAGVERIGRLAELPALLRKQG